MRLKERWTELAFAMSLMAAKGGEILGEEWGAAAPCRGLTVLCSQVRRAPSLKFAGRKAEVEVEDGAEEKCGLCLNGSWRLARSRDLRRAE